MAYFKKLLTLLFVLLATGCTLFSSDDGDGDGDGKNTGGNEDVSVIVDSIWWSDVVDEDEDGYILSGTINIQITAEKKGFDGDYVVEALILYRHPDSSEYVPFKTISDWVVEEGTRSKAVEIKPFLPQEKYQFKIVLSRKKDGVELLTLTSEDLDELKNVKFEDNAGEEQQLSIKSVEWRNTKDGDDDGYSFYRELEVDVDVNYGDKSGALYLEYKKKSDKEYKSLSSVSFNINTDKKGDAITFKLNRNFNSESFEHGEYDFKLSSTLAYSSLEYDGKDDSLLKEQKWETFKEDEPLFTVDSLEWVNIEDVDGDGYAAKRTLKLDPNVSYDSLEVTYVVSSKLVSDTVYNNVGGASGSFKVYNDKKKDTLSIELLAARLNGARRIKDSEHDFKIVFRYTLVVDGQSVGQREVVLDLKSDSLLGKQKFEESQGEAPIYTVDSLWWSDAVDADSDDYNRSAKLNVKVGVNYGQFTPKVRFEIMRNKNATAISTQQQEATVYANKDSSTVFSFFVGKRNFNHGLFDFRVFVARKTIKDTAIVGPSSNPTLLAERKFELAKEDTAQFSVTEITFSDEVDKDGDGVPRSKRINISAKVNYGGADVYYQILTKHVDSNSFVDLSGTNRTLFRVAADSARTAKRVLGVGIGNKMKVEGKYDFQVKFYRARTGGNPFFQVLESDSSILRNHDFESQANDANYKATATWSDSLKDDDNDGYTVARTLLVDVDILDYSGSKKFYIDLYVKKSSDTGYEKYGRRRLTTAVRGEVTTDATKLNVGPYSQTWANIYPELSNGIYDFSVEIFAESDTLNTLLTLKKASVAVLGNQKFEDSCADKEGYCIANVAWVDSEDEDKDGYTFSRNLVVDVDVSKGTYDVIAKLLYKHKDSVNYLTTNVQKSIKVVGTSAADKDTLNLSGLSFPIKGGYDFKVEVTNSNGDTLAMLDANANNTLKNQKFESGNQDSGLNVKINEIWWSDSVDTDQDGYTISQKLNFKVQAYSGASAKDSMYAWVRYSGGGLLPLVTSPKFIVTEDGETEISVTVESGTELSNGSYNFTLTVYDYNDLGNPNDDIQRGVSSGGVLNNKSFETVGEDVPG